jgi:hypothetical protein
MPKTSLTEMIKNNSSWNSLDASRKVCENTETLLKRGEYTAKEISKITGRGLKSVQNDVKKYILEKRVGMVPNSYPPRYFWAENQQALTKEQKMITKEALKFRNEKNVGIGMEILRYVNECLMERKWFSKKPKAFTHTEVSKEESFCAMPLVDFCEKYKIDIDKMKEKVRGRMGYRKNDSYFEDTFASFMAKLKVIDSPEYFNNRIIKLMKEKDLTPFQATMSVLMEE